MATGLASAYANAILDMIFRAVTPTPPAAMWAKLHLGDPGSAGLNNAAANTTRKQVTCAAASGGSISNSAALLWSAVPNTETVTHLSFWTASVAGTFVCSAALNASVPFTAGDDGQIDIGALSGTQLPVAA